MAKPSKQQQYLKESRGRGNKESGSNLEKSTECNDMGSIVVHGKVRSQGVARGLDYGSEQSEGTKSSWVCVK